MLDDSRLDEQRHSEPKIKTDESIKGNSSDGERRTSNEDSHRGKKIRPSEDDSLKEPFGNSMTEPSEFKSRYRSIAEDGSKISRLQTKSIDIHNYHQSSDRPNTKFESSGVQSLIKNSTVVSQKSNKSLIDQDASDPNSDREVSGMGFLKSGSRTFNVSHLLASSKEHKSKSNNIKLTRVSNSKKDPVGSSLLSKIKFTPLQTNKTNANPGVFSSKTPEESVTSRSFNQSLGNDSRKSFQDQQTPLRISKEVLFKKQSKVPFSHNPQYFSANDDKNTQAYFNYEQN